MGNYSGLISACGASQEFLCRDMAARGCQTPTQNHASRLAFSFAAGCQTPTQNHASRLAFSFAAGCQTPTQNHASRLAFSFAAGCQTPTQNHASRLAFSFAAVWQPAAAKPQQKISCEPPKVVRSPEELLWKLDTRPIERRREGTSLNCSIRIIVGCLGRSSERISSHSNCVCDYQRADKRVSRSIGIDLLKFPCDSILLYLPWPHADAIARVGIPCFGIVYHHRSIGVERGEVRLE